MSSRVAIVHDYLSQYGGGERLVLQLSQVFPDAPIYTSFFDPECTFGEFRHKTVVTSRLQRRVRPDVFRRYAPLYPLAFRHLDLREFDLVVASSSAFAHHVRHPNCWVYCHTPPRFVYQPASYGHSRWSRRLHRMGSRPIRWADRRAAQSKTGYAANSRLTQARIREAYGVDATVIYPPVTTGHLPQRLTPLPDRPGLLVVSRLLPYKRVDLAIRASEQVGVPLRIVGDGPDRPRLEALAHRRVEFLGQVPDRDLAELFATSSAVLAPGVEDFGFAPVEAHWAGRPVVATAAGGALETVADGVDGRLVADGDVCSWAHAIRDILDREWDPQELRSAAQPFRPEVFRGRILRWLGARPSQQFVFSRALS